MAVPVAQENAADAAEDLELELLLEGVFRRYGYDFRGYATATLRRRLWRRADLENIGTLTGLLDRVLHDPACLDRLLGDLSINVTEMFRDPTFHRALRERAMPVLRTYPFLRIWVAGCSTGEEVVSLAVTLREEGLLDRSRIYATDMNAAALRAAARLTFAVEEMELYERNYERSGGPGKLSDHYTVTGRDAVFDPALGRTMVFAQHNLASDRSFNEFHLILCRNVMIYFGRDLQRHVHELFLDSLAPLGLLGLGRKEALADPAVAERYEPIDAAEKLFRRRR